jgi:hypothetical protein
VLSRARALLRSRPLLHVARMASRPASCAIGLALLLAGTPGWADNFRRALYRASSDSHGDSVER